VRRLDAAFFLSALGNGKRKKAASSRRTPKGRWGYKFPFLVKNLLRKPLAMPIDHCVGVGVITGLDYWLLRPPAQAGLVRNSPPVIK